MGKKFLVLGVALIMVLGLFAGCGTGSEVEFKLGSAWSSGLEQPVKTIVRSLDEWKDSASSEAITIDESYDDEFFSSNALVIVAFTITSGGGEVEKVTATKNGNHLKIEIIRTEGTQTVMGVVVVVLEVKKDDIIGINNISYATKIN